MKKLLMLGTILTMAVSANAASYLWKANSGRLFDGQGSATDNRYAGTGYLFDASAVSQSAIIAAFNGGTLSDTLTSALSTGSFSSGRAGETSFTGPDNNFTAYFVVLGTDASGNDAVYISDTTAGEYTAVGVGSVTFGQQNAYSSAGFLDAASGYSAAGWYSSAAAVPEPTSGLLMLLGMAGLALRRRRV